jgi:hypothetical protein
MQDLLKEYLVGCLFFAKLRSRIAPRHLRCSPLRNAAFYTRAFGLMSRAHVLLSVGSCAHAMMSVGSCAHAMMSVGSCAHAMLSVGSCAHAMMSVGSCAHAMLSVGRWFSTMPCYGNGNGLLVSARLSMTRIM